MFLRSYIVYVFVAFYAQDSNYSWCSCSLVFSQKALAPSMASYSEGHVDHEDDVPRDLSHAPPMHKYVSSCGVVLHDVMVSLVLMSMRLWFQFYVSVSA